MTTQQQQDQGWTKKSASPNQPQEPQLKGESTMSESNAAVATGTFTAAANSVRSRIKDVAFQAKMLTEETKRLSKVNESNGVADTGEMIANLMLCYRHLEDASMRLGKAIQAHDGGVSVYDRATTVGA